MVKQEWQEDGKILVLDLDTWTKWLQFATEREFIVFVARKQGYNKIKFEGKTLWTRSKGISL